MKVPLLVLTVAFSCEVLCDQATKRQFEISDGIRKHRYGMEPSRGFLEDPFNNYGNINIPPSYYGLNRYAKNLPMIYNNRNFKFLPRPYPQLRSSVPTSVTFDSPHTGHIFHDIPHPPIKLEPQTFYTPSTVPAFISPGLPRYALSPVRQYIPQYYPLPYTPEVSVPSKFSKINMNSFTTASPIPDSTQIQISDDQYSKDNDDCYEEEEPEYYNNENDSEEYENDDESDHSNEDNDNEENRYVNRIDKIIAEDRKDGPLEVNALLAATYDDGKKPHDSDEHYSKKNGAQYSNEHKSKKGYKTTTGHDSEHKFDKGEKGHHDKEVHYKQYDEEGENNKKHHNEKNEHESEQKEDHGEKKGEFDEKKKYKKGAKTKGYHNVFHKDEFVKDHTIYDDLDQSGNYKKFEEEQQGLKKENAKHKKGSNLDSSKHSVKNGNHGNYNKGHHDNADSGYEKKIIKDQHYNNNHNHKQNYGATNNNKYNEYLKGI